MSVVYGPVPSWRLGRSLGVDPLSTSGKTCSFDCVYCQLGRTRNPLTARRVFVKAGDLLAELRAVKRRAVAFDYITFSGVGEPTLAENLGELAALVREVFPHHPLAILTNASLMPDEDVRRALSRFDVVVAKVDAPNETLFRSINRPFVRYGLEDILEGIRHFKGSFAGKLALQMMFIEENMPLARDMAALARALAPDEVQLNTPLRPSPVRPLNPREMAEVEAFFRDLPHINVYKTQRPRVTPLDEGEMRRRRPASAPPGST